MTSDMTTGQSPPVYEVYDVEDTFGPVSLGGSNRVMRVHFHVAGASDSYVDVPFAQFNAATVARMIEDHVSNIIDVRSLKGPTF